MDPMPDAAAASSSVPPRTQQVRADASREDRTYAMVIHLLSFLHGAGLIAAIVMWLTRKDQSPFIADHGREAINFHISLVLYTVLGFVLLAACGLGAVIWVAEGVLAIVGVILASIAAHEGRYYRYPACIRLIHE
jgi:uncharacterized Tic20 family protein